MSLNRPMDHTTFQEWLQLESDGELPADRQSRLEQHLAGCEACRAERRELQQLSVLLEQGSLPVRPDFRHSVLQALPATGWEARHPRTWRFPAVAFLLLGGCAAAFLGLSSARLSESSSVLGAFLALGGLLQASVLAGAGLLGASWKGLGLVLQEVFASRLHLGAFAVLVLCLNLLLFSLIRSRRPSPAFEEES